MSGYKKLAFKGRKSKTPKELLNQGVSPSIEKVQPSVKALQRQGTAPTFSGQGYLTPKQLMKQ